MFNLETLIGVLCLIVQQHPPATGSAKNKPWIRAWIHIVPPALHTNRVYWFNSPAQTYHARPMVYDTIQRIIDLLRLIYADAAPRTIATRTTRTRLPAPSRRRQSPSSTTSLESNHRLHQSQQDLLYTTSSFIHHGLMLPQTLVARAVTRVVSSLELYSPKCPCQVESAMHNRDTLVHYT